VLQRAILPMKLPTSEPLALCYHAVSDDWPAAMAIAPRRLERQVSYLLDQGYSASTFTRACAEGNGRTLVITFDDACRSVLERALPILTRLGVTATLFAPTQYLGCVEPMSWPGVASWLSTPHRHELLPLRWDEVKGLADAGWEIGSHTMSHPYLTELDDHELRKELVNSRAELERRLGRPCSSLAYPFGDCDQRVADAARDAGYACAAALLPRPLPRGDRWMWPRVMVCGDVTDEGFRRQVHPAMRRVQGSRLWPGLAAGIHTVRRLQGRA
jgi:peptidoglycan/xylan/chitin deacetylase (PgdA/CDA1 family)